MRISKSIYLRNKVVSLLYIVFLSTAYMSVPDRFLNNSISISETLKRATEENKKSFEESVFLGEVFEVIELNQVQSINELCDTSLIELKEIENGFIQLLGGKDEYGMVRQKAEVIPVLSYFLDLKNAEKVHNILIDLKNELNQTIVSDSIITVVDSILFPEKKFLDEKAESWNHFYFKNTPAMQAHVQLKNISAKVSLVKSMLTRHVLTRKLREISIENFKEVTEVEEIKRPELDRIKLVFRKGFYDERGHFFRRIPKPGRKVRKVFIFINHSLNLYFYTTFFFKV